VRLSIKSLVSLSSLLLVAVGAFLQAGPSPKPMRKWTEADLIQQARRNACAVSLTDGRILVAGGANESGALTTTEMITLGQGSEAGQPMINARQQHACVVLNDGKVLAAGGKDFTGAAIGTAELFDPSDSRWHDAGVMISPRAGSAALLLRDGRVLLAGGEISGTAIATAEIFDPVKRQFSGVDALLSAPRKGHAGAVLPDGRVLLAGGSDGSATLDTVDVFDPKTGQIAPFGRLSTRRAGLSATALLDGRVLFAGGNDGERDLGSMEIIDADGATVAASAMESPRSGHLAVRVPDNNTVLMIGGTVDGRAVNSSGRYIPWQNSYEPFAPFESGLAASSSVATKLPGGVIITGESGTRSAERLFYALSPTIRTNFLDYVPGQWVSISGENWTPGNKVDLTVRNLSNNSIRWQQTGAQAVVASANGAVAAPNSFLVVSTDIGETFSLTAVEQETGNTAQVWTFTDAPKIHSVSISAQSPNPVGAGSSATYTVTVNRGSGPGSPGAFSANILVAGLPPGSTASALPISLTSSEGAKSGTLTIATLGSTPTGSHTLTVTAARSDNLDDNAATTATLSVISVDSTPPVITSNVTGTLGNNGWYTSNVNVTWTVTDAQSTVSTSSGCGATTITTDTAGTTITCSATSAGGTNAQSVTIKRDATAPSLQPSSTYTADTWTNQAVTVNYACSDSTSGVASPVPSQTYAIDGSYTSSATCVDNAGNAANATFGTVKIDKVGPTISGSRTPAANSYGWNNTDVTVSFTCSDSGAGLAAGSPPLNQTLTTDGANQSAGGTCTDLAGNSASATVSAINIDKTTPVTTLTSRLPAANPNGWNKTNVEVIWGCSDALSGVTANSFSQTASTESAGQSVTGSCQDKAGNSSQHTVGSINIDKTMPILTPSSSYVAGAWTNQDVVVNYSCTDALSGVAVGPSTPQNYTSEGITASSASCTDNADNKVDFTFGAIKIDKTPPTIISSRTLPNGNGWNNENVTVSFNCSDAASGLAAGSPPPNQVLTNEGLNQSASGSCKDIAGNSASTTVSDINIDKTAPSVSFASPSQAPNAAGWHNTNVSIPFTASDALSTVDTVAPTSPLVLTVEGYTVTGTVTVKDRAGNSATFTSPAVKIDKTKPSITGSRMPAANPEGWNKSNVTVSFVCSDNGSGLAAGSPPANTVLSAEGAGQSATGACTDIAGNSSDPVTVGNINIDWTAPAIAMASRTPANVNGWNNTNVTVTWTCSDALSGSATPVSQTATTEGANQLMDGVCSDKAGNTATNRVTGINIDKTPPQLGVGATANGAPYSANFWTRFDVTVTFACTDPLSGVATVTGSQTLSAEGRTTTVPGSCLDKAGNSAAQSFGAILIDKAKPVFTTLAATPNPIAAGTATATNFTATVSTGGSLPEAAPIASMNYRIDAGSYATMAPLSAPFDSLSESASAAIPLPPTTDVLMLCSKATDQAGNESEDCSTLIAVYDPSSGFVTGGGWIISPVGAYTANPGLTGKATFGFVSKYQKGANVPTGETEFQFQLANMKFKSTSYDWLVVAGAKAHSVSDRRRSPRRRRHG
jgi:hypothetical protein